ncbi:hypothetical protein Tcan_16773 [Toxocara canis]|uniref:F-box domain-containing protein n=1 Tax=Toxocara canis TaxID=6265 RepID=A0A0B2UYG3_TOXCA|nr:hypothetical protein Tcan_16773 [Toxocara canis]
MSNSRTPATVVSLLEIVRAPIPSTLQMPSLKEFVGNNVQRLQRKLVNESSLLSLKGRKRSQCEKEEIVLADNIWSLVFDHSSPFDLISWRRVNGKFKRLIDKRFENVLYLDVYKMDITAILPPDRDNNGLFYRHKNAQLLLQLDRHNATIIVHERWASRDVTRIFSAIQLFARSAQTVLLDVAIVELVIAGLSSMDLSRWFAFQCYLRTLEGGDTEDSVHVQCIRKENQTNFFPRLKEFSIRVAEKDFPALSRMRDYAVDVQTIFSLRDTQLFRVILLSGKHLATTTNETAISKKRTNRHLRAFKKWIGSIELGERYCQQYS